MLTALSFMKFPSFFIAMKRVHLIPLCSVPNASRAAEYLLAHFGKAGGSLTPAAMAAAF